MLKEMREAARLLRERAEAHNKRVRDAYAKECQMSDYIDKIIDDPEIEARFYDNKHGR